MARELRCRGSISLDGRLKTKAKGDTDRLETLLQVNHFNTAIPYEIIELDTHFLWFARHIAPCCRDDDVN